MATEIKLPRLGQGMESGTIVKWLKAEGDEVEKGEPLYELDTDKVTQEVEADASGVLLKIAVAEGEVEVGKTIAVIGREGEEVAAVEPPEQAAPAPEFEREPVRSPSAGSGDVMRISEPTGDGRIKASPLARHRAVNALYRGDAVELHPTANIGIAVAIPNGLVAPVIPGCERRSIAEIAAARADVVERARTGKLQQPDLEGGTFTISNLGM